MVIYGIRYSVAAHEHYQFNLDKYTCILCIYVGEELFHTMIAINIVLPSNYRFLFLRNQYLTFPLLNSL